MDHDAWENQIIQSFERREGKPTRKPDNDKPVMSESVNDKKGMSESDKWTVAVGLRRTLLAFLTLLLFAASAVGFVAVASARGYMAVLLFFASTLGMLGAFIFVYAQGITNTTKESQGESK